MTNQNNTPTAPGWYYRDDYIPARQIIHVQNSATGLVFMLGTGLIMSVENDGRWRGPVPMPGDWVPREIADCLYYEARNVDNNDSELLSRYAALTGIEDPR